VRPAAGVVGVVASPLQGAWKSIQKSQGRKQEQHQRSTRISDGVEAVKKSSKGEQATILEKFEKAKRDTWDRQKNYRDFAEKVMYGDEHPREAQRNPLSASSAGDSAKASTSSTSEEIVNDQDDVAFVRDMELAKKLSLVEQ